MRSTITIKNPKKFNRLRGELIKRYPDETHTTTDVINYLIDRVNIDEAIRDYKNQRK